MSLIRNFLALLGALVLVVSVVGFFKVQSWMSVLNPEAPAFYFDFAKKLIEYKGDVSRAASWRVDVAEGVTLEDVEQAMAMAANEYNIKTVAELPLGEEVKAQTGQPWRYLKIMQYCNALTAKEMIDFSDYIVSFIPCRVAIMEDANGKLALFSMDMDMILKGGPVLPPELEQQAEYVKETVLAIMNRGANGEF